MTSDSSVNEGEGSMVGQDEFVLMVFNRSRTTVGTKST